ncbi:hypothetical protein BX616_007171 [Lobosporangium transversale]|nr:hypothetical protein BX616_007171 [Lobosporangium transversale]
MCKSCKQWSLNWTDNGDWEIYDIITPRVYDKPKCNRVSNANKQMLRNPQQDQMTHPHDPNLTNDIPEDKHEESTLSDAKTPISNQSSNEDDSVTSTKTYK